MKRICFVGASTTEGMGDETGQGWPGRLSASVRDKIVPYNLGVRGQLLAEIGLRASAECTVRIPDSNDGGIVFCSGMNDIARVQGIPRTPSRRVLNSFDLLLEGLQAIAPLIVVGPLPVCKAKMPYHSEVSGLDLDFRNDDIEKIDAVYAERCQEYSVPYLSVFSPLGESSVYNRSLEEGDGLHPGGAGYEVLARKIAEWPAWNTLIA
jgi:acyl-CoA thioesterase-1